MSSGTKCPKWLAWLPVVVAFYFASDNGYAAPVISGLTPNSTTAGGPQFTLTVNGSGFGGVLTTATVQWNGSARQTTFVSSTQLTAVITATDITTAGTAQVTVRNQPVVGDPDTSAPAAFTINNPVPVISSLSPTSVVAGGPNFTLTVNGSNFVEGSRVRLDDTNQNTTFVSQSQLTARIQDNDIRRPGTLNITVVNPTPGGGSSNTIVLNVTSSLTITTSSTLPAAVAGSPYSQTLTATGGTLPYSWSVTTGSLPSGLALASSTGVLSGTPSSSGSFNFTVAVSDSGQPTPQTATKAFTLVVSSAAPVITSISPSAVPAGSPAFTLTANGSNFVSGSTVRWNGSNRPTTFASSSQLTAAIPATDVVTPGTAAITVINPGGAASNALTLTISAPELTITTNSPLPQGTVGAAYSQTLVASGGTPPYTWSVTSGALPAGLALNTTSGALAGTPSASGDFTFAVRVSDSASGSATKQFQVSIGSTATPSFTISGVSGAVEPAQQPSIEITLAPSHPSPVSGQLTLKFTSNADVASDDPTIQFSTGGRVVSFSIPANSTRAIFSNGLSSVAFQTGTVSGNIELSVSGQSTGSPSTPLPSASRILTLSRGAPAITRLNIASRSSSGFDLTITGFSTPRSLTQAIFRFTASQGANLETNTVTLNLATPAATWFQSQTAASVGGQFRLLMPFAVQGEVTAIQSVSVTLANGEGISSAASVQF